MTGTAAPNGVEIVYTYTYGCQNTFTVTLTEGSATAPGQVTSDECNYKATWAGLPHHADILGTVLIVLEVLFLLSAATLCFVRVSMWSKEPITGPGPICGIPLEKHDANCTPTTSKYAHRGKITTSTTFWRVVLRFRHWSFNLFGISLQKNMAYQVASSCWVIA